MRKDEKDRKSGSVKANRRTLPVLANENSAVGRDSRSALQGLIGNRVLQSLLTQPKPPAISRISEPGDVDEIEADRIAEQVVSKTSTAEIRRKCSCDGNGASCPACQKEQVEKEKGIHRKSQSPSASQPSVGDDFVQSLGSGRPLEASVRQEMESEFGHDFSAVRIHTDSGAATSAASIGARAFTADQHIVFGEGEYSPRSGTGRRLLAHELAHAVQNSKPQGAPQRPPAPSIKRQSVLGAASSWFSEKTGQAGKWVDEKKWAVYRAIIASLKSQKQVSINLMRGLVPKLPQGLQGAASSVIDVVDFFVDIEIALLLAIIGLAVGFVEGIVGLIVGLVKLAIGLLKMTIDWLVALMGKPDEYQQDIKDLVEAIKGIPPGLTRIKDEWLERYKHATLEEQVLMGGELVGQIEAFIATFVFAGTKAGQATTLTVRVGGASEAVLSRGAAVLETAPATAITIPAVVPKTAAEAAVVSSQMMMMGASGPGAATAAGGSGGGGGGRKSKPKGPEDEGGGPGDQQSKTPVADADDARLQKKYGERSKTQYPASEWRSIEQLEDRFPKLKDAKLRPIRRPATGDEAIFEERMQTTQSGYGLAGYSSDGQQIIQFDGISPDGWVEEIKIEQAEGNVDDIVTQLRRQADFARDYGLKGVEYSVQPATVADEVEARVAQEHLRNVYRAR